MPVPRHRASALFLTLPLAMLLGILPSLASSRAGALSPSEVDGWRCDLRHLQVELPRVHPEPFTKIDRATFERELLELERRLKSLEPHEIVVDLARIVALLGDGHTRLTLPLDSEIEFFRGHTPTRPSLPDLVMRQFPVRFGSHDDRLLITAIGQGVSGGERVLGREVIQIGGLTTEDAIEAVSATIQRDNEWQLRYHLPERLVLPDLLHARGVIDQRETLELRVATETGDESLQLQVVPQGQAVEWRDLTVDQPVSMRPLPSPFLMTQIDGGILYLRIDEIGDGPGETLAALSERLEQALGNPGFERLVIDLRHNRGGDNSLSQPLVHALIRSPALREAGSLFVLTGRATFSAAMMLAVDLERHTRAIFVGEPTGSSPNHHGDASKRQLPYSGLTVRISTRQWQYSHPLDQRTAIVPTVDAPQTVESVLQGRDPALDWVVRFAAAAPGIAEGRFEGRLTYLRAEYAMAITVEDGRIFLDVPELGLRQRAVRDVERRGERLGFTVALGSQSFRIEAEARGDELVGYVDDRRRGGTLALRRAAGP